MTDAIKPTAYAFRHSYGKTTLHPAEEYATAYRDTCVGIAPLYPQAAIDAAVAQERALIIENAAIEVHRQRAIADAALEDNDRLRAALRRIAGRCDTEAAYKIARAALGEKP